MKLVWVKCRQKRCRNKVVPRLNHSPYCPRCATRRFKEKWPLKYSFNNLRKRAKERGKDWSLTYQQYEAFAIKTDYAKLKGKTSVSLSIDRRDDKRGYHADNIQAITIQENSRKQYVPYFKNYMNQTMATTKAEIESQIATGIL